MVIVLKSVLTIFCLILILIGYYIYGMFKDSINSEDYENSSLLGKFISVSMFIIIMGSIACLLLFLIFLILSKITIIGIL